ncbi:hypothetical protein Nepgr_026516 [Nepenthes gracilis]|uniref:NPH3 domain-containing protein n=1 Tax=Nepenthes gracilis TaxID=150966 RepID=A0AAD3Y0M5_NEPGR|nr:hypothetical protein Nepgr_026516 [Nepenthes gracilis]
MIRTPLRVITEKDEQEVEIEYTDRHLASLMLIYGQLVASSSCKNELEKRISATLEHVTVNDLLILSFTYDGEGLFDLESMRRIIAGSVEKERNVNVFNGGNFKEVYSIAMQQVAKTVDAYLGANCLADMAKYGAVRIQDAPLSVCKLCKRLGRLPKLLFQISSKDVIAVCGLGASILEFY